MEQVNALSVDRPFTCGSRTESKKRVNRWDGNAISRQKTQTPSDDMRALWGRILQLCKSTSTDYYSSYVARFAVGV